jgi:formiminotetrahydrofolate cyclodeaminase
MADTLTSLQSGAAAAAAQVIAAKQRLQAARKAVVDRSWEHHNAVVASLDMPKPTGKAKSTDPVAVAQERLAAALADYDVVTRELGVGR